MNMRAVSAQVLAAQTTVDVSVVYDPPLVAQGTQATTTVTATGAALGDYVAASFSLDLQGMMISGYVSAANTVTVAFRNGTLADLNLASGTLKVRVTK